MSYTDSGFDKRVRNLLVANASAAPPPPPAPPSGMLLWLAGATLEDDFNNGDPITTWRDTSGNGLDAAQAVVLARPTLESVSSINNQPAARFADDASTFMDLPAGFADFTAGLSLFMVVQASDVLNLTLAAFGLSNNAVDSAFTFALATDTDRVGMIALQPGVSVVDAAGVSYAPALWKFTITGASVGSVAQDHIVLATGAMPTPNNVARNLNFVGSDALAGIFAFCGRMAEVVLYDRILSAADEAEMDAYISDRYAL